MADTGTTKTEPTKKAGAGGALGKVPVRGWIALALIVAALVFIFQNTEDARVRFLFVSVISPLWCALAVATGVGVLIGLLGSRRSPKVKK